MKKNLLFFLLVFIFFAQNYADAQNSIDKNILISKENLRQILTNNNKKQNFSMIFEGFDVLPTDNYLKIVKENKTEISTPKKKATIEVVNNVENFRKFLETNNVKYVYADGLKIKTSNIITQEEANKLSSSIIDIPAVPFTKECNDSTKIEHYKFQLYYYETKLYVSMDNYSANLLKGYIDNFQAKIEETKAILNKFN